MNDDFSIGGGGQKGEKFWAGYTTDQVHTRVEPTSDNYLCLEIEVYII